MSSTFRGMKMALCTFLIRQTIIPVDTSQLTMLFKRKFLAVATSIFRREGLPWRPRPPCIRLQVLDNIVTVHPAKSFEGGAFKFTTGMRLHSGSGGS